GGPGCSPAATGPARLPARALPGASLDADAVLPLANELEGHPDNVAPCLLGGLTIAWVAGYAARAIRLEALSTVRPVAFIAPEPVSTRVARDLLPPSVPHADAARNAGRAALLVAALTARPDALLDASEARLHQDYRAPAMPATHDLVGRLRAAGVPAVTSGAGPSVLAFLTGHGAGDVDLAKLDSIARETGTQWRVSPLAVERHGASAGPSGRSTRRCGSAVSRGVDASHPPGSLAWP